MPDAPAPEREGKTQWDEVTKDKVLLLSVIGSVASIAALAIALLDKIAANQNLEPQLASWRAVLFLICLMCIGSTFVFTVPVGTASFQ